MRLTSSEAKILLGYLFINIAYYSSLPYLAIYLKVLLNLNPIAIAFVIAAGPVSSCIASVGFGKYIDRCHKKKNILLCLLCSSVVYVLFSFTYAAIGFLLANSIIGFTRGIVDTIFKTYLASSFSNKISAFGCRAIVINLSAAIGPLLGYYFAYNGSMLLFLLCAFSQIGAIVILLIFMPAKENDDPSIYEIDNKIPAWKNKTFLYLLASIILSVACYSQIDSSLPVILTDQIQDGVKVYFLLLLTNAVSAILFQPIISYVIEKYDWLTSIKIGLGCFLIAFSIALTTLNTAALILMITIFTIAELLIFQAGYLGIDRLSPSNQKGQYYGIANLDAIGSFIGPFIGCGVYQIAGVQAMYLTICTLLVAPAYFFLVHAQRGQMPRFKEQYSKDSAF